MTASELKRQLVVFSLHGQQYAVPIASVREIIRHTKPTAVGATSGLMQGMINLRGQVLPVVDLSSRLGQRLEIDSQTRILVLEVAHGAVGLIVDTVDGVREIPAGRIEPLPVAAGDDGVGDEIAAVDDQLIVLLDPERTLGSVLPGPPAPPASTRRRRPATSPKPTPTADKPPPGRSRARPAGGGP